MGDHLGPAYFLLQLDAVTKAWDAEDWTATDSVLVEMTLASWRSFFDGEAFAEAYAAFGAKSELNRLFGLRLQRASATPETLGGLANFLRVSGNPRGGAQIASKAPPDEPIAAAAFGLCLLDLGSELEAIRSLGQATNLLPGFAVLHFSLGIAYRRIKRFAEATSEFRKALQLKPEALYCWHLAESLQESGSTEQAVMAAERGLELNPCAESHYRLAGFLVADRRHDEAEPHLRRAVELEPEHAKALEALGSRLQQLGQFRSCRKNAFAASSNSRRTGLRFTIGLSGIERSLKKTVRSWKQCLKWRGRTDMPKLNAT